MESRCDTIGKHSIQIVYEAELCLTLIETSSNETLPGQASTNVITEARINMQDR